MVSDALKISIPLLGLTFSLTLEPVLLMYNLGGAIFNGAQQTQNLLHRLFNDK